MLHPLRVLLVDDEKAFVDSLRRILVRRGIEVSVANDGSTAISLFRTSGYDVVVLDMRMPGMDGLSTLRELRNEDPLIPVIMLTGHMDLERTTVALKEGATEILTKPCSIETLITSIENAAERSRIARELNACAQRHP